MNFYTFLGFLWLVEFGVLEFVLLFFPAQQRWMMMGAILFATFFAMLLIWEPKGKISRVFKGLEATVMLILAIMLSVVAVENIFGLLFPILAIAGPIAILAKLDHKLEDSPGW